MKTYEFTYANEMVKDLEKAEMKQVKFNAESEEMARMMFEGYKTEHQDEKFHHVSVEEIQLVDRLKEMFRDVEKVVYANPDKVCGAKWLVNDHVAFFEMGEIGKRVVYKNGYTYHFQKDAVCYVPEDELETYEEDMNVVLDDYEHGEYTVDELYQAIDEVNRDLGWTGKDILEVAYGQQEVADYIFQNIKWEFPQSFLKKELKLGHVADYNGLIVLTNGENLNKHLYGLYKADWCKERNITGVIDERVGINGECYAGFDVFVRDVLPDKNYMMNLIRDAQVVCVHDVSAEMEFTCADEEMARREILSYVEDYAGHDEVRLELVEEIPFQNEEFEDESTYQFVVEFQIDGKTSNEIEMDMRKAFYQFCVKNIEVIVPEHPALDKIIESAQKNRSDASKGNLKQKEEER